MQGIQLVRLVPAVPRQEKTSSQHRSDDQGLQENDQVSINIEKQKQIIY